MDSLSMTQHLISVRSFHSFPVLKLLCLQHLIGFDSPWLKSAVTVQRWSSCDQEHLTMSRYSRIGYFCTTSLEVKREPEGTSGSFLHFNQMQVWCDLWHTKITPYLYSGLEQNVEFSKRVPSSVTARFQSASLTEACQQALAGLLRYLCKLSCPEDAV